jgi:hypothetical protein
LKNDDSPKSVALSCGISDLLTGLASRKFSGLRSRWMTPMLWQCATTPTMQRMSAAASFSE